MKHPHNVLLESVVLLYICHIPHASSGLNYKSLMSGEDPLGVLSPFLTASSIHTVANMASNIPSSTGGYLTPSELYRHFAEKLFWEEREEVRSEEQEQGSILVRYEKCHEYLVLLDASDLLEFLKEISVTRRALHVSHKCIRWTHSQQRLNRSSQCRSGH